MTVVSGGDSLLQNTLMLYWKEDIPYHTVNDKSCAYFVSRRLYCVLQLVLIFQYYTCCFYICITIGDPVIKRAVGIPLTGLTPPHFSVCPKPRPGFPVWYVVVVFVFSYYLRWEVKGDCLFCWYWVTITD